MRIYIPVSVDNFSKTQNLPYREAYMTTILLRTIVIYLILVLSLRLTGKRQIGEMQLSELVVTFMLSELAVFPITYRSLTPYCP